jgi:hypothetical protein
MKNSPISSDSNKVPKVISYLLLFSTLASMALVQIFNSNLLLQSYFGNFERIALASVSFMPVLAALYCVRFIDKPWLGTFIPILAGLGVILSYSSTLEMREFFSRLYGIYLVQVGLADWLFIPNFIGCQDSSGCDPLGRVPGYGLSWKAFVFLSNETLSVYVLAIAAVYVIFEVGRFANNIDLPFLNLAILLSPSFLFALERGNSDILLFAFVLLGTRLMGKYRSLDFPVALFLSTLKPFFFGYIFRLMPRKRYVLATLPLFFLCYFWSMSSNFQLIKSVRVSTLYPPLNQIGAEQLPSFLIQFVLSGLTKKNLNWNGGIEIFYVSLIAGLVLTILMGLLTLRYFKVNELFNDISELPPRQRQLTWISMGVFIIVFLSGSQVSYKTWMVFPLFFLLLKSTIKKGSQYGKLNLIFVSLIACGCLGINVWVLRTTGTLLLAGTCIALFLRYYFPTVMSVGFFKRSNQKT